MQQAALLRAEQAIWLVRFLEKKLNFFWVMVRSRNSFSLVFRLSMVYRKFKFSTGIQLFGLKTTSQGIPGPKNSFFGSDLRCGDILVGEVGVQGQILNLL